MNPEQRSVLVTGASSGIGQCVARGLKARGYRVFATARRAEDVERLRSEGFAGVRLDLDDSDAIAAAVEQVLEASGGSLHALCNNAGYGQPGAVEDLSREAVRAQFETNVFGTLELTNHILPVMRRQGHGRIIQVSSIFGVVTLPYRGAYCASKYALESLSDALRQELAGTGIHVSLIEPGPIRTEFRESSLRMLETHVRIAESHHETQYRRREAHLKKQGAAVPLTLGPEAVLKKVIHALESPRPQARYCVTLPAYVLAFARRVLPTRLLDRLLVRIG